MAKQSADALDVDASVAHAAVFLNQESAHGNVVNAGAGAAYDRNADAGAAHERSTSVQTLLSTCQKGVKLGRMYVAHRSAMNRVMVKQRQTRRNVTADIESAISNFIDAQTATGDHCHSQLLNAKEHLHDLHQAIDDLAGQVNATETEIQVLTQSLQETENEIESVQDWTETETERCTQEHTDATNTLATLTAELEEMRQIARPDTAVDITTGEVKTGLGLLQATPGHVAAKDLAHVSTLVANTKSAAASVLSCVSQKKHVGSKKGAALTQVHTGRAISLHRAGVGECSVQMTVSATVGGVAATVSPVAEISNGGTGEVSCADVNPEYTGQIVLSCVNASLTADAAFCTPPRGTPEECEAQRAELERSYVEAYVELSGLKTQYEAAVSDTSCQDAVDKESVTRLTPLQERADELTETLETATQRLPLLRPRLEAALSAEVALRAHIAELTTQCAALPATLSSLGDVRTAIQALQACPGLGAAVFSLPQFAGFARFRQQANTAATQAAMESACSTALPPQGSTSASPAEMTLILAGAIEHMPTRNDLTIAVLGTCAAGSEGASCRSNGDGGSASGFMPGTAIRASDLRSNAFNAAEGIDRAALCVYNRNLRDFTEEEMQKQSADALGVNTSTVSL